MNIKKHIEALAQNTVGYNESDNKAEFMKGVKVAIAVCQRNAFFDSSLVVKLDRKKYSKHEQ